MESPNVPKTLANARTSDLGFFYEPLAISYFLSRESLAVSRDPGRSRWRERLFAWMVRMSTSRAEYFHLPLNRVVELGTQVKL